MLTHQVVSRQEYSGREGEQAGPGIPLDLNLGAQALNPCKTRGQGLGLLRFLSVTGGKTVIWDRVGIY